MKKGHIRNIVLYDNVMKTGAEEKTRTSTGVRPLDPEPSVSTNSTTSASQKGGTPLVSTTFLNPTAKAIRLNGANVPTFAPPCQGFCRRILFGRTYPVSVQK